MPVCPWVLAIGARKGAGGATWQVHDALATVHASVGIDSAGQQQQAIEAASDAQTDVPTDGIAAKTSTMMPVRILANIAIS